GRRIEKNVNGAVTAYLYDLSSILLELDASGTMQARYTHGPGVDEPLMMERGGQAYFYHQDGAWNVVQLTDGSGNAVCSYSFGSFGRTQPCQSVMNPYGFAGREYDAESSLYYMRARYYDPVVGRFISPDPLDLASVLLGEQDQRAALALLPAASAALAGPAGLGSLRGPQQLNPYSYALNNPAALRDPSGLKCEIHFTIGMEPVETGASALRDDYFGGTMTPEKFDHWLHVNNYSISYVQGSYAAIHDSHLNVVGVVRAEDVGITPVSYPQYTTGQALAIGLSEIGQILKEKFEASLKVDWNKLHGQQYWDAANNPENYVKR
ncbi:MAG: RHS repeat-associated core domain-containing protein, partial [Acidobacteria bacterium]|nr:RHS repeat-associated core domain-containing protein [Acidobacteriota bacterium]